MNELNKAILLHDEVKKAINTIDESMSVNTFANAIALVLLNEYGKHNYEKFITALKIKL